MAQIIKNFENSVIAEILEDVTPIPEIVMVVTTKQYCELTGAEFDETTMGSGNVCISFTAEEADAFKEAVAEAVENSNKIIGGGEDATGGPTPGSGPAFPTGGGSTSGGTSNP